MSCSKNHFYPFNPTKWEFSLYFNRTIASISVESKAVRNAWESAEQDDSNCFVLVAYYF